MLPNAEEAFSIARWLEEQNRTRHVCKCGCGTPIVVRRHHRYQGIPVYIQNHHPQHYRHAMTVQVEQLQDAGLLTSKKVAELLGIGVTTLRRLEGVLAESVRRYGKRNMRVFTHEEVEALRKAVDARRALSSEGSRTEPDALVAPPSTSPARGEQATEQARALLESLLATLASSDSSLVREAHRSLGVQLGCTERDWGAGSASEPCSDGSRAAFLTRLGGDLRAAIVVGDLEAARVAHQAIGRLLGTISPSSEAVVDRPKRRGRG